VSNNRDFARAIAALTTVEIGLLVLIAGSLSAGVARELAAARRDGRQGIALLLATSTWATQASQAQDGQAGARSPQDAQSQPDLPDRPDRPARSAEHAETTAAEVVLRSAGWRVVTMDASTPLSVAWQRLPKTGNLPPLASQPDREVVG
jgi:hypothetical protein